MWMQPIGTLEELIEELTAAELGNELYTELTELLSTLDATEDITELLMELSKTLDEAELSYDPVAKPTDGRTKTRATIEGRNAYFLSRMKEDVAIE
jgi:hypothetical protein